jgi:hypothetical protein
MGRRTITVGGTLVAVSALAVVGLLSGTGPLGTSRAADTGAATQAVNFEANAGTRNKRILDLGGLLIRASCTDYGKGRTYLSVAAKTKINNAAKAVVLSQRHAGRGHTYAFSSGFDRADGWYDFTGTNPANTTGTLSYSRPDGGQVTLTFRADEGTHQADCIFRGPASFTGG